MGETARRQAYRETLKILMTMVSTVHWCGPPMMSDLYLVNQVLPLRWHSHPLLLYLVNQILPLRWHSHPLLPCSRAAPEHHSQTIPKLRGKDLLDLIMQNGTNPLPHGQRFSYGACHVLARRTNGWRAPERAARTFSGRPQSNHSQNETIPKLQKGLGL